MLTCGLRTGHVQHFETAITPEGVVQRPSRREESSSDDEYRRFKVSIKWVADVDLEAVMKFCRANESSPSGEEECLTGQLQFSDCKVIAVGFLGRDPWR